MSHQERDASAAANQFHVDTAKANELFVEAAKLLIKSQNSGSEGHAQTWLKEGFFNLTRIIENYPSTDLAVKLVSGQSVGDISLKSYGEEISHWEKYGRAKSTSDERDILDEAATFLGL